MTVLVRSRVSLLRARAVTRSGPVRPRVADHHKVADRIDDRPLRVFLRPPTQRGQTRRHRQQRLQQRPLSVDGIGGITAATAR